MILGDAIAVVHPGEEALKLVTGDETVPITIEDGQAGESIPRPGSRAKELETRIDATVLVRVVSEEGVVGAIGLGVKEYMVKPVSKEDLAAVLKKTLPAFEPETARRELVARARAGALDRRRAGGRRYSRSGGAAPPGAPGRPDIRGAPISRRPGACLARPSRG